VLRHFPTFRVAWETAGVQLANRRQAPWTPAEDWYVGEAIGVLATATIAADLGRSQSAIYTRIRHLERRITEAWGWPIQRVSRTTRIAEHTLRGYIERGELPVFKGAKCVYVDPADLLAVDEVDWTHPPADLELAALDSLRLRLTQILAGRDWRQLRPHRPCPLKTAPGLRRGIPRAARPASIAPGTWVRVVGPTPAMPQRAERIGCVDRVYWSISSRQDGPPQWRAKVVFARAYRKQAGTTITYCLPVAALEPAQPATDDAVQRCP